MTVTVRFVGSGDAFGSGGRLQTCIMVDGPDVRVALDFGAPSLVGLRRLNLEPNSIDAIVLTHLHGDHCGGVPFLLVDGMLASKRTRPLTIAGPHGTAAHLQRQQHALFPGSDVMVPRFAVDYVELGPHQPTEVRGVQVSAVEARHTPQTHPLAVRLEIDGTSIAYTGDGEFTDALADLVDGADLLIAESYFFDRAIKWHLNYPDLARLNAKRTVLTHMHDNMLAHAADVPQQCAYDGLVLTV